MYDNKNGNKFGGSIERDREISPEERYANTVIKAIMIDLDLGFPSEDIEAIAEEAYEKKQALRAKIVKTIHQISELTKYYKIL